MNLKTQKRIAAQILKVGITRVKFDSDKLNEIKEAITRQDILDLNKTGAIQIRDVSGRTKIVRRKHRRRTGKIKKQVKTEKKEYVTLTRKLRKLTKHLLKTKAIDKEKHEEIRRRIRAKKFRSRRHLNESLGEI